MGLYYKAPSPPPDSGDLLPPVRLLFLKIPRPPETAPPQLGTSIQTCAPMGDIPFSNYHSKHWTTWSFLTFFHFSCCFTLDSFYLLLWQIHAGGRCHVCGCSSVINYLLTMCKALNLTSIMANILYILYIFNMIFNIFICNIICMY